MPFYTRPDDGAFSFGREPRTGDEFVVKPVDRFSGAYIVGKPGYGKTGFLKDIVGQDIRARNTAVFFLDPHGDAVDDIIAEMQPDDVQRTYLLDMTDEEYPFGINVFSGGVPKSSVEFGKRVNRVYSIFDVLWPDVMSQAYLPLYLQNAVIVLLANPGSTLVDMLRFLSRADYRERMLANLKGYSDVKEFWEHEYGGLTEDAQRAKAGALLTRLHTLFTGKELMKNIMGQRETTISFRKLIEQQAVVLIKLPLRELEAEARLVGTMLVSMIHGTVFSYGDTPESQRPGVSLYVDEFQNFATKDFDELFTEGRKYRVRLTLAHQFRGQIPSYLRQSMTTARSTICFRLTPDDASEMARFFPATETTIKPEDIEPKPIEYLMKHGCDDRTVMAFLDYYVRPLDVHKHDGKIELEDKQLSWDFWGGTRFRKFYTEDPLIYLNPLLRDVMKTGHPNVAIPYNAIAGFANEGRGFAQQVKWAADRGLLNPGVQYPERMVAHTASGLRWIQTPASGHEQLMHCIFHIRRMMEYLAEHPIGKVTETTNADVATMLTQLPVRAAFVRSGDDVGVIYTHDTPEKLTGQALEERMTVVRDQTRKAFCKPREDVEGKADKQPPPASRSDLAMETDTRDNEHSHDDDDEPKDLPDRWE